MRDVALLPSLFAGLFVQALIFGFFCSYIASQKGRSQGGWFALGFAFSFLALLALVAVPSQGPRHLSVDQGGGLDTSTTNIGKNRRMRTCPYCAESILVEAVICRFCQRDVDPFVEEEKEELPGEISNISDASDKKPCPHCSSLLPSDSDYCLSCMRSVPV